MPYYNYKVRDKNGKLIKSQTFAMNKQELIKLLHKDNFLILSVEESAGIEGKYKRKLHKRARLRDLALFAKELAILLENGVPLIDAFDVALKQIESSNLLKVISEIKKDVEAGSSFKDAVSKHNRVFGELWPDMIETGELSGQLPSIMRELAGFIDSRMQVSKKVVNAFIYPALLLIFAVFAIFVFVFRVVPIFEDIFSSFGGKLPVLTTLVIKTSYVLRRYFFMVVAGFIALVFVFRKFISTPYGRRSYERFILNLPILGGFFLSLGIERFASTLGILTKSGIPVVKALEVSEKATQSLILAERIDEAKVKVTGGLPLSEALQQTGLFPPLAVQLILVAEKTGNFSGMLEEVSKYYNDVVDTFVTRFTTILEPLVLVCMVAIIGTLVIAMFMPIFKLTGLG